MRRAGWSERGAGADPYRGMTDEQIDAALEARWRLGIELSGGSASGETERCELLGTRHEFSPEMLRSPWRWDEADPRFDQ